MFEKDFDTESAYNDKYLKTNTTSYQNKIIFHGNSLYMAHIVMFINLTYKDNKSDYFQTFL